jgi:hypothetical protein
MNFNEIRMWLINHCCFCVLFTNNTEQKLIPKTDISANEYIKWKKRGFSDYRIFEITGYHY